LFETTGEKRLSLRLGAQVNLLTPSQVSLLIKCRLTVAQNSSAVDIMLLLVPLHSTGLTGVGDAKVHLGFLDAYNAVALDVLRIVQDQLVAYPSYRIIITGHSLGGAVAALGAISIKSALPGVPLKLFTFGLCSYGYL